MWEAGVWEALSSTGWPPWPWEDCPLGPPPGPPTVTHTVVRWSRWVCVQPHSRPYPGLMETSEPGGPGEDVRALCLPELEVLHEVLHGHLVQKHKVGFAALWPFLVHPAIGRHPGQVTPAFLCRRVEGRVLRAGSALRAASERCGEVGSGFWSQGGAALPTCCSLPRGSDPGFLVPAPRGRARLTVSRVLRRVPAGFLSKL